MIRNILLMRYSKALEHFWCSRKALFSLTHGAYKTFKDFGINAGSFLRKVRLSATRCETSSALHFTVFIHSFPTKGKVHRQGVSRWRRFVPDECVQKHPSMRGSRTAQWNALYECPPGGKVWNHLTIISQCSRPGECCRITPSTDCQDSWEKKCASSRGRGLFSFSSDAYPLNWDDAFAGLLLLLSWLLILLKSGCLLLLRLLIVLLLLLGLLLLGLLLLYLLVLVTTLCRWWPSNALQT